VYPSNCVFWDISDERGPNFGERRLAEVRGRVIPRTSVNKGKMKDRDVWPRPYLTGLAPI
jgi:hypothetical protein